MAFFMKQEDTDELQALLSDFTAKFSMYMVLGFKDMVIENAVAKLEGEEENPYQLLDAPVPDWDLKTGFLTKRGGSRKNWHKRWFVAKNAADGFVIEYYTDKSLKTQKGSIGCAGYKAEKDDKTKKCCIALVPEDVGRRTWYISCDSEEERDEWMSVFENACDYASPAKDKDPMVQGAFEIAFENLKRSRGIWWRMRHDRSPAEMLTKLLAVDIGRELEPRIIGNISDPTGGMLRGTARNMVKSLIATMCFSACNTAWSGAKPAIDSIRNLFVEKVDGMITPIVELQVSTKATIVESISAVTDPAMSSVAQSALSPVLSKAMDPIVQAFKAGMRGFHSKIEPRLGELADAAQRESTVRDLISDVSYSYASRSPMVEAYQLLREMRDTTLGEVIEAAPGISVWAFTWQLDDGLRTLIRKAIYTCSKLIEEGSDSESALGQTMERFVADAKYSVQKLVKSGLKTMISSVVDENLMSPCIETVQPISEAIPEPMQEIVSIDSLLADTINDIVDNGIEAAAGGACSGAAANLDNWQES